LLSVAVRQADAGLDLSLEGMPQGFDLQGLSLRIWGTPWDPAHDGERGNCLKEPDGGSFGKCPIPGLDPEALEKQTKSYLTAPTAPCGSPLSFKASASSWQGALAKASSKSHDQEGNPLPLAQCNHSLSKAKIRLTSEEAAVGSGLSFELEVNDGGGITNPQGIARPAIKEALIELPEGLTINPSVAVGLGACSEADFAKESLTSKEGEGCPNQAKVGEVRIEGMLGLPEPLQGSLYVATPRHNPFGSLLALYVVARDPDRGLFAKSAGEVEPDPRTGRLRVTFQELPSLLYTRFEAKLREGQRALLLSPPACGSYLSRIRMSSWAPSDPPSEETNAFNITRGAAGAPCPSAAAPPFHPALIAGSQNPSAATYTPVTLHIQRSDSEQEIVSYGAKLPPGLLAKVAGTERCPEAQIEAAKRKSAAQELRDPSCPAASQIGRSLVGGGIGRALAYAPGALYLAGPYQGAALSVVAITAAQIGPFDLGTVVVRATPRFDSQAAQLQIDPSASDPIPHLLAGIPIHVREIRVYVDRPNFTLNPTSCDPFAFASLTGGSGADPFSPQDDAIVASSDRFQVLNCAALGFKPRLRIEAKGQTRRGAHPSLKATYRPRPGEANLKSAVATLPHAFFLEQAHIRSICSLAQFRARACPPSSVYGYAKATSPLLEEPLQGPVYLRSSNHKLPDLLADLRGLVDVEVIGRIDATKASLRASFEALPDAPVSEFVLTMRGQKKGLLVNSRELCGAKARARVRFVGQNGKVEGVGPVVGVGCGGGLHKLRER
jgi:hypothetical protein